jgi:uncharacterized membrane protein YfcA
VEYIVICTVALAVSGLTLFSGFGLGTLLMPAFAIFFPVSFAVAATAVVHLANNLFKVILVGKHADVKTVVRFTVPAAIFAAAGAFLLGYLSDIPPLVTYSLAGRVFEITTVKAAMAILIAFFAVWDLSPRFKKLAFDPGYVPVGGAISGFFGGLSGLQGALRSAVLLRCGLSKEAFIATGAVSTVVVDMSRLLIYGMTFVARHSTTLEAQGRAGLIAAGICAAFTGSFVGAKLMKRISMKGVQMIVGIMLLVLAIGLGTGVI